MNVLILHQFANHNQTIDGLCNNLNKSGIEASSFNVATWRLRSNNKIRRAFWLCFLRIITCIPGIRGIISNLLRDKAILKFSADFTIIDIHFFSPLYDNVIEELKKRDKKVKITIWGSDFYRVKESRLEEQRKIYQIIDIIQIETRQIADDFLKVFPECSEKVRIAHFGLSQFDIIDELSQNGSYVKYKKKFKIPEDKIVLTCGTNASEGQQHLRILQSIENLAPEIKEQLFLIIPLTYGGNKKYIDTVKQKAHSLGIPCRTILSFLSKRDTGILRIVSDIILTIQVTDALSCTHQEYMYSGNILITGDWLPYGILKENGVYYLTTAKEKLTETITETIDNYKLLKNSCLGNKDKLAKLSSWDEEIKEWLTIYYELDNKFSN